MPPELTPQERLEQSNKLKQQQEVAQAQNLQQKPQKSSSAPVRDEPEIDAKKARQMANDKIQADSSDWRKGGPTLGDTANGVSAGQMMVAARRFRVGLEYQLKEKRKNESKNENKSEDDQKLAQAKKFEEIVVNSNTVDQAAKQLADNDLSDFAQEVANQNPDFKDVAERADMHSNHNKNESIIHDRELELKQPQKNSNEKKATQNTTTAPNPSKSSK